VSGPDDPRRRGRAGGDTLDLGLLPDLLGFHLRCAQVAVFQHFHRAVGMVEISPPQLGALLLIEANPGISQSAIAEALRFDRSTLVQIVDRLERRGLMVREPSASDRRSHALKLTAAGAKLLVRLKELVRTHEDEVGAVLSVDERRTLIGLLRRLHESGRRAP
jgi:DNA-binding MarR family transcriptional regulator